jgi:hypothetical protein
MFRSDIANGIHIQEGNTCLTYSTLQMNHTTTKEQSVPKSWAISKRKEQHHHSPTRKTPILRPNWWFEAGGMRHCSLLIVIPPWLQMSSSCFESILYSTPPSHMRSLRYWDHTEILRMSLANTRFSCMPIVAFGPGPFSGLTPQRGRSPVVSSSSGAAPNTDDVGWFLTGSRGYHDLFSLTPRSQKSILDFGLGIGDWGLGIGDWGFSNVCLFV